MILEVNLVKTQAPYTPVGVLMERQRYNVENEVGATTAICKFIGENLDVISPMIVDKAFLEKISSLKNAPIDVLTQVRAILCNQGLDIWSWVVAEAEVNPTDLTEESFEYNIVDNLMAMTESQRFCTKLLMPSESIDYTRLYTRIKETFNLYTDDQTSIFLGTNNPYDSLLQAISAVERPTGGVPSTFVSQLSTLCKFLGKEMYLLTNQ